MTRVEEPRLWALCAVTQLLLLLPVTFLARQSSPGSTPSAAQDPSARSRPRVVVTTDGEQDDLASMHRFILYANDLDVAGIVQSSSRFHHAGDASAVPPISQVTWLGSDWIHAIIRNYAAAYAMLKANDPRYSSPEYLHSVVKAGNITDVGEFAANTEGSDWIKAILLDNDPRPVYISVWGGTNTAAATLRSIRDQYLGTPQWDAIRRKVSDKTWLLIDLDQDTTYKQYIATTWPDVNVVMNNRQYGAFAYAWTNEVPVELKSYFQAPFQDTMIRKGPILADYSLSSGGRGAPHDWFSEGDSPQFIQQFPVGLSDLSHYQPSDGNWGGRYLQKGPHLWVDNPPYLGFADAPVADESPYRGAADFPPTAVVQSAWRGATRLRLGSVANLRAGDVVTIGSNDNRQRREIATVGTAQGPAAKLSAASAAGATNVKVDGVAGFGAGDPMTVGTGADRETRTVARVGKPATSTTVARPLTAGATTVTLGHTANLTTGDRLTLGSGASAQTVRVVNVGKPSSEFAIARATTTLAAGTATIAEATVAGAVDVPLARVTNFVKGQTVRIGTGDTQEMSTLETVGVGGGSTLGLAAQAGSRNVKVLSTANFLATTPVWIDAGANLERAVISAEGLRYPAQGADQEGTRAAGASTTAAPLQAGATNIKVVEVRGFLVGAPVTIDEGPSAETVHISLVGAAGATGTGIDIVEKLAKPHAAAVPVSGAGLTFTAGLRKNHAAGAPITANAAGLTSGLKYPHAAGAEVVSVTPAGTRSLKVASVAGFAVGKTVIIDAQADPERATIAALGTAGLGGTGLTLASPTSRAHFGPATVEQVAAEAGAADIKLANVPLPAPVPSAQPAGPAGAPGGNPGVAGRGAGRGGAAPNGAGGPGAGGGGRGGATPPPVSLDAITVGDHLTIDEGANAEQVTVTAVGSGGLTGSGVSFRPALRRDHNGDVAVRDEGTGITFTPAVRSAVPAGVAATSPGTGITLTAALSRSHAAGVEARGLGSGIALTQPVNAAVAEGEAFTSNMNAYYPQARWTAAIQNDFAARADWQIKPYAQANHPPVVSVPARALTRSPGQTVALGGTANDPDGNQLTYKWWQYREAGTYLGAVVLSGADTATAKFTVPQNARPGQTIHLILEVQDSGTPPLTRYQRVIVTVGGAPKPAP